MNFAFPPAFENRMRLHLQQDWEKFSSAHRSPSPVSIRINPAKGREVTAQKIPWTGSGYYLDARPSFTLDPLFHAGAYYVQDASSMFLEQAVRQTVDLRQSLRVLDLCAAPGGKSTHLLSLINSDSLLVTNEVIRPRATVLSESIQKWGYPNALVTSNDPNDFHRLPGFFDLIVVDAPCSGEGLFRKDPEAMNEWSQENIALCSQRQRRILSDSWSSLKENGILIYCTCTYNESENEDNLLWLQEQRGLEFLELRTEDSWGVQTTRKANGTGYRFYPHQLPGEGFFMAVVRKTQDEVSIKPRPKSHFATPLNKTRDALKEWCRNPHRMKFILQDDLVLMIPVSLQPDIEFLCEKLRVLNKGTAVATLKRDKLVPEHAFALSIELQKENFQSLELTREEALAYLRKENLRTHDERLGFTLMTFEGLALGWSNLLVNRMNNLYPASWRIRMAN
jgi:16S rRNA C967 or C1407 C5-methylase (RsmB/RsmF family)/NOL1/NOP2/fmu family ribosome biogenesis protein